MIIRSEGERVARPWVPSMCVTPPGRPRLLVAARVVPAPGEAALVPGAVLVTGSTITAGGAPAALAARHPGATRVDLGDTTVVPGLVNVHVHLAFDVDRDPVTPPVD